MSISMFIVSFVISFYTSWKLTLVLSCLLPFLALSGYFVTKAMQDGEKFGAKAFEKAGGIAEETIYSIKTVASFSNYPYEINRFNELLKESMRIGISNGFKTGLGFAFIFFIMYNTYSLAIWYGSLLISDSIQSGKNDFLSGDVMVVMLTFIFGAFSLGQATPNLKAISTACVASSQFFELLERKSSKNIISKKLMPDKDNVKGKITFKNVTFSYPSNPNRIILDNFDLEIEAGMKVAIVGESGSGKSTIFSLLERFYEISEGYILLDGIDIKDLDLQYYRTLIGYVSQEPVLFNISLKDNIIFGRENVLDTQIEEVF